VANLPAPPDATLVGTAYSLEPAWLQFAEPVSVTLTVDPARLPAGSSLDGVLVLTTAADAGVLALPSTMADATHVRATTTHFATGASALAGCPVQCSSTEQDAGPLLQCSTTCVGHAYSLSCAGPPGSEPCTCATDGVVTAVSAIDAGVVGALQSVYLASCDFPSTSWAGPGNSNAGDD